MKFDKYDCWKHRDGIDVFFFVNCAYPTGLTDVILLGHWMIQGVEHHWMATDQDRFVVTTDQYENWTPFEPQGIFI